MDHHAKNMIVEALIQIVDEAPHVLNKEMFDLWTKYISSVMNIISSYTDVSMCLTDINDIVAQQCQNNEYGQKVAAICRIVLDFAQKILYP